MIEVKYNREKDVLIWRHVNILKKQDIFAAIEKTNVIAKKIKHLKIIEINGNIEFDFTITDILVLNEKINPFEQFETVKHAFVGNIPKNVAFFTVATDILHSDRYASKVFSLEAVAYNWLKK